MGRCRRHQQCVPRTARVVVGHRRKGREDWVCLSYIGSSRNYFNTYLVIINITAHLLTNKQPRYYRAFLDVLRSDGAAEGQTREFSFLESVRNCAGFQPVRRRPREVRPPFVQFASHSDSRGGEITDGVGERSREQPLCSMPAKLRVIPSRLQAAPFVWPQLSQWLTRVIPSSLSAILSKLKKKA
jgi:hypothetical protein